MKANDLYLDACSYARNLRRGSSSCSWEIKKSLIIEESAVLEYCRLIQTYPEVDPKDILLEFRYKLIERANAYGDPLYLESDNGLKRMGYFLNIDKEDSLSQYYKPQKRRIYGR